MATDGSASPWIFAGLVNSLPNIEPDATTITTTTTPTNRKTKLHVPPTSEEDAASLPTPCKILQPSDDASQPGILTPDLAQQSIGFQPQALIFRYRNKIYAIDHACPHRTYPLSRGTLYDIEDFGVVLSAGISCPKHGWSFDLHTGESDRGGYRLGLWEVKLRGKDNGDEEVWVRRKERQRMG